VVIQALHTKRTSQLFLAIGVSVVIGIVIGIIAKQTSTEKHQWASRVSVLVASRTLRAGESLTLANTHSVDLPEAIIADDAIADIPTNATTRIGIAANTPLSLSLISSDDAPLQLPEGWKGVALPVDLITPPVHVGDTVDVVARDVVIAAGALVAQIDPERGITLAVPGEQAATVATAAQIGEIGIVLSGK
jgi:Flp pilus assembly protein CpaB